MATHNILITATDKSRATLQNVDNNLDKVTKRSLMFKGALGLAAGAMAALGSLAVFGNIIGDMDKLAKSARNVGVTTELGFAKFQVIKRWMEEAGISSEEFDRSMRNLTGRMAQGLAGNKAYAEIMEKLGGSIFDANGKLKDAPGLFQAVASAVENGSMSLDEAQKLLGEMVGPKIFNAIKQLNVDGTTLGETLTNVAESMNIVSLDDAKNAEAFGDAMDRLKNAGIGLLQEFIVPFLPAMTTFVQDLAAKAPGYLAEFTAWMEKLQPLFNLVGTILNELVIPALSIFIDFLVKMAEVLAPLVDAALPYLSEGMQLAADAMSAAMEYLEPMVNSALPGLTAAFEAASLAIETVIGWFKNWEESLQSVIGYITDLKDKAGAAFGGMGDDLVAKTEAMTSGIKDAWYDTWDYLVGNSVIPEIKDAAIASFQEMDKGLTNTTQNTVDEVISDYDRLQKALMTKTDEMKDTNKDFMKSFDEDFNSTFADALVEGNLNFDTFAGLFKSTLKDLITDSLNGGSQLTDIFSSIFGGGKGGSSGGGLLSGIGSLFGGGGGGGLGGIWDSISSGFGSIFGGFFANGGSLPSGKIGIAGESGPELITGPARITPTGDFGGGAASVNITIQAIDTQTGTEFLLKNKQQIEGIIQSAYSKRGKQGIY